MDIIRSMAEYFTKLRETIGKKRRVVMALACLVVFVTTYALILPAITLDEHSAENKSGISIKTSQEEESKEADTPAVSDESKNTDVVKDESGVSEKAQEKDKSDSGKADKKDKSDNDKSDKKVTSGKTTDKKDVVGSEEKNKDAADKAVAQNLEFKGKDFIITVKCDEKAGLPEGTDLKVTEIRKDSKDKTEKDLYKEYHKKATKAVQDDTGIKDKELEFARFFDISFVTKDGEEIEPAAKVNVKIEYDKAVDLKKVEAVKAVHFDETLGFVKAELIKADAEVKDGKMEQTDFDAKKFSVYGIVGSEKNLETSVITAEGKTYKISVGYDEKAEIPDGAELKASEIKEGTKEFDKYLAGAASKVNAKKVASARFFDIEITDAKGKKIEPKAPVNVKIEYEDAMKLGKSDELNVVHFAENNSKETPEVIKDVMVNNVKDSSLEISYRQDSFSVTGTIVQTPEASHNYALVVKHTDGKYYVVESDGTLTKLDDRAVSLNDDGTVSTVMMVNPICWTYSDIGYDNYNVWHDTDAWSYDRGGTNLPTGYVRRFLNVDVENGYQDVNDNSVNVWNEAIQYNPETHRFNHYDRYLGVVNDDGNLKIRGCCSLNKSAEVYFAETKQINDVAAWNHTVNHIDIAVEGTASLNMPLAYGTYQLREINKDDLPFIDKKLDDNSLNFIGKRDDDLVVNDGNDLTLSIERKIPITKDDIKKADISAYTDYSGTRVELNDVYNVTGYSGNSGENQNEDGKAQVRLEGSFKVSDVPSIPSELVTGSTGTEKEQKANTILFNTSTNQYLNKYSTEWDANYYITDTVKQISAVRKERPINYTVAVTKPITFTLTYEDPATHKLYVVMKGETKETENNGVIEESIEYSPFRVTVETSLSSSFSYWDADNECPAIHLDANIGKWENGELYRNIDMTNNKHLDCGPGMDFRLGANADAKHSVVAVEVTKYIQGKEGNTVHSLKLQNGTKCKVNVYQNINGNETLLHDKTVKVGTDGIGSIYDYDVTAGTYNNPAYARIKEVANSVDNTVVDSSGHKWIYSQTKVQTEYNWRKDGDPKLQEADLYDKNQGLTEFQSKQGILGEYYGENNSELFNRFLEFYVYNIYVPKKYPVYIKKVDIAKTTGEGLEGAEFDLYGPYERERLTDDSDEKTGRQLADKKINNSAIITPEGGVVKIGDLSDGIYYLYETKAPAGYDLLPEPVKITVDSRNEDSNVGSVVTYEQTGNSECNSNGCSYITEGPDASHYQLLITNTAGVELPSTGGIGTTIFYILGGLMIVMAAGLAIVRRRRVF